MIFLTPFLKSYIANYLSSGSISPCKTIAKYPNLINSLNKISASAFLTTKIIIAPFSYHSPKTSNNLRILLSSDLTSINCSIFVQAYPFDPTIISTGLSIKFLAKVSTFLGKVAENITVYLSALVVDKIFTIWGSKP